MPNEDKQTEETVDLSNSLSNDEFMANFNKMMIDGDSPKEQHQESVEEEVQDNPEETNDSQSEESSQEDSDEESSEDNSSEEETKESTTGKDEKSSPVDENKTAKPTDKDKEKKATDPAVKSESSDSLYKDTYDKLFGQPIKASGRSIQLKTVDEVISLVQKGLDYTKKSQSLAEERKAYANLNKAEIDDKRLALLIDVHKGDKDALKSLLKSSKIDPMDLLDADDSSVDYKPKTRLISDADIKLNDVVEQVNQSEHKDAVWKVVQDKKEGWDNDSYNLMMKNPELILALNHEMETGRFKTLQEAMDRERALDTKRAKSLNDIQLCMEIAYELDQLAIQKEKETASIQSKEEQRPVKKEEKRSSVSISGNRGSSSVSSKSKLSGVNSIKNDAKFMEEFNRIINE